MSSILFTDHPVCQLMAEKAMHDPKYRLQLERCASKKEACLNMAIEDDMTKLRHRLLMLSKIEDRIGQPRRRSPNAHINGEQKCALLSAGRAPANSRRALTILAENQRLETNPGPFPILRLPLEIRQQIYGEVLKGTNHEIVVNPFDISAFRDDYHNRHIETFYGNRASPHWKNPVTTFDNAKPNIYGKDITTGLLRVSKSMYDETVPILYQSHTFDFGIDVFGIVPFLSKMTPLARQNFQNLHMELFALPAQAAKKINQWHVRENAKDWAEACAYMADHLQLKKLSINVDMKQHKRADAPVDFSQLQWVKDLVKIQGLQSLSHHVSLNGHGLEIMRPGKEMRRVRDAPFVGFSGTDDVVDGDLERAQPGLGRLFKYLRGEMLEKPTRSDAGLEAGA